VCKIQDFGQIKYEQEKLKRKQKAKLKKTLVKGIRITFGMAEHDMDLRKKNALKFLEEGHRVKVEMALSGREHQHAARALERLKMFAESVAHIATIEEGPKRTGRKLHLLMRPSQKQTSENSATSPTTHTT